MCIMLRNLTKAEREDGARCLRLYKDGLKYLLSEPDVNFERVSAYTYGFNLPMIVTNPILSYYVSNVTHRILSKYIGKL